MATWPLLCAIGQQLPPAEVTPSAADEPKSIEECQVVGRIDGQVVLSCEILWQVNSLIEANRDQIPADRLDTIRQHLMKRQLASMVDTKLLYGEFRRTVPEENLPKILENLAKPFEEREIPRLLKELKVENRVELERKLLSKGSSLEDARRAFNEKAIAGEWLRSKVKVDNKVGHEEMLQYYKEHLSDYEYPTEARWEELMVMKSRFDNLQEAFSAIANMGNLARGQAAANPNSTQPVFTDIAKAKSHGYMAQKGGLHDWTTQGALKSSILDGAIFSLPVGQMSRILETDTGFHIVRVLERKQAGRTPFTEVQADIRDKLREERFRKGIDRYLTKLHRDARIWTIYTGDISAEVFLGRKPSETVKR